MNNLLFWMENDAFFHSISSMLFNWRTPYGYGLATILQSSAIFSMLIFITTMICWVVGCCRFFLFAIKDITSEFSRLNATKTSEESEFEWNKQFFNMIRLYTDVKRFWIHFIILTHSLFVVDSYINDDFRFLHRFVNDFNEILEIITFSVFVWTILTVSSSLITFLQQLVEYWLTLWEYCSILKI